MDLGYGEELPNGPGVRRRESPLRVDRQVVLVADEPPGAPTSPRGEGGTPYPGRAERTGGVLESLGDVWITPEDPAAGVDAGDRRSAPSNAEGAIEAEWGHRHVTAPGESVDEYRRFADRVLHPIAHSALTRVDARDEDWRSYRAFNDRFASAAGSLAVEDSIVWFSDHHTTLAPALARERVPDGAFLFHFWSSPWPGWDTFRSCPHAGEIVEGLLGNDLVGFYVPRYVENFLRAVDELVPDATIDRPSNRVHYDDLETAVRSFPMSVPFDSVQEGATASAAEGTVARVKDANGIDGDRRVVLGIDRTAGAIGIRHCLRGLEREWAKSETRLGQFTLILLGPDSGAVRSDEEERPSPLQRTVDRINGRFETGDWQPIVRPPWRLSRGERYGLYRDADAAIVGSVRAGVSVRTQEFIAAQSTDPGVLLLSDQTGTSDWLGEASLTFRPLDPESFVRQFDEGLGLSPTDRRRRMAELRRRVKGYDDETWVRHIYGTIRGIERRHERDPS